MEEFETAPADNATSASRPFSFRQLVDDHRDELLDMFITPGASGLALARRHAAIMDVLLARAYDEAIAAAGRGIARTPIAMTAVGSYGRGRLGWKSDIEVRFITSVAPDKIRSIVSAIVNALRSAGIEVHAQIASVNDTLSAAAIDMRVATALLDGRVLAGDHALFDSMRERAYASVFSAAQLPRFFTELEAEADTRRKRLGDSIYMLEPDVKSGTGGTRDLDIALWAATARWKTSDPNELQRLGVLSARDVEDLQAASEFMWTLRNRLHLRTGRRSDHLSFSEQETIARALGYPAKASESAATSRISPSVETLMADYYRHARDLLRISDQIVRRAKASGVQPAPRDLGAGMSEYDGSLGLSAPAELVTDPTLALRLYASAVERNMTLLPETRAAIAELVHDAAWVAALRASSEANALLIQLVSDLRRAPFRSGSIVSELHDVGLLVALLPEFAPLVGRVHREASHVYTVDAHSLVAVERLRALLRGELAQQHPVAHRWASQVTRPHVLCFATLLHDIGKVTLAAGHVPRGADMARAILARLGFSQDDNAAVCELIRNQLKMYLAAVRRDLEDPATLTEFTREGQSLEGLRDLYLLTIVCISTVSPSSMTKWKAGMLDALFSATEVQLRGEAQDDPGRVSRTCMQFKQAWADQGDAAFLDEFIDSMPDRYLSMHSAVQIAAHARVAERLREHAVSAALVPSRHPDVAELCVVTETCSEPGLCVVADDQPGLLASITAAIAAAGLEVHSAQIHSRFLPNGAIQAVDLFWVRSPEGPQAVQAALPQLERDLELVLTGRIAPSALLKRDTLEPGRSGPRPATEIVFNQRASTKHTVIEVFTKDRPGLLFTIAQALHELGVSIAIAMISTEGDRASDVFYVSEFDGAKLGSEARIQIVQERLLGVLDGPRG